MKNTHIPDCIKVFEEDYAQARKLGFYRRDVQGIMQKIKEETAEADEAVQEKNEDHIKEELGDLIHAVFSLCCHFDLSPEKVIQRNNQKFQKRYNYMCKILADQNITSLTDRPLEDLIHFWRQAKEKA